MTDKILVVDDDSGLLRALKHILEKEGYQVVTAEDGREAMYLVYSEHPDLILLDIMMPQMDGLELAERIRQTPGISETTLIVLSSAGNLAGNTRCRELGIDYCLMKPVKQSELLDSIVAALSVATADEAGPAAAAQYPRSTRSLRILLAEDGLVNQKVAVNLLEQRGHKVTVANNGQEAVDALDIESFDVVLMDVQMPELDGMAATRKIREMEEKKGGRVPIIALTAHAMKGDKERFLDAGMDDYISKPLSVQILYRIISSYAKTNKEDDGGT